MSMTWVASEEILSVATEEEDSLITDLGQETKAGEATRVPPLSACNVVPSGTSEESWTRFVEGDRHRHLDPESPLTEHLQPEPEDLELEIHKEDTCC